MTTDTTAAIRPVLGFDALTCLGSGALMTLAAAPLAALTGLPEPLLFGAGLALLPIAALFFVMSRMQPVAQPLLWLAVLGNLGWVVASVGVAAIVPANALGVAFVLAQAAVVAVLAILEARGLALRGPLAA